MVSTKFYSNFKSEFVLIFQVDTLIRHAIPPHLFRYDYIGAPWTHTPAPEAEFQVGNGGFSLRRVSALMEIARLTNGVGENEDVITKTTIINERCISHGG